MAQQKGGRKLSRSGKDKNYYDRQYNVTLRNKARRKARFERKMKIKPNAPIISARHRRRHPELAPPSKPPALVAA